jgi:hypothetical protein
VGFKITPLKQDLFNISHSYPPWNEDQRLRVGTAMADGGGNINNPAQPAISHWPGGDMFQAQSLSLADCINEGSPPGDAPNAQALEGPCDSVPPTNVDVAQALPPHGELCFAYPRAILDANSCEIALSEFAAQTNLAPMSFNGDDDWVRTMPLDSDDPNVTSTWQDLETALGNCGDTATVQSILESHMVACDNDGQPLNPDEAFQTTPADSAGETDLPVESCH